jgi:putative aldouronate transport system permease protein
MHSNVAVPDSSVELAERSVPALGAGGVHRSATVRRIVRDKWLYILVAPGVLYFIVFKYLPMLGLSMAFMDFTPYGGFTGSRFVGLKHFARLITEPDFLMVFRNTMVLSVYNLLFYFPVPIVLALLLNEARSTAFKRTVQTVIYIPHFISWPVIIGLVYVAFTTEGGIVNDVLTALGFEEQNFLASKRWFRPFIIGEIIFKEAGWGTIIYLAALAGVDVQLYEAATIDGANRFQKLVHVTLPHLASAIVILFILRLGKFMESGFEQVFLMLNSLNRDVGDVFDTYVYAVGLTGGQYSYSAAVGLFKSVVSLVLVIAANRFAKRLGQEGVY